MTGLFFAMSQDDELKRLRHELDETREALRKARFLLDLVPFYVAYVDGNWTYQMHNAQAADWLDHPEDAPGKSLIEVFGPDVVDDDLRGYLETALGGDHVAYDSRIRLGDRRRHIRADYVPDVVDGEVRGVGAVIENMTARRLNEERVRQAAVLFDASRDAIMIFDAKHHIKRVNSAFTELTGYSALDADRARVNEVIVPLRGQTLENVWDGMVRNGHWTGELYFRHKDGSVRHVWVTVNCVADEKGFIHNYVAVLTSMETHNTLSHLAHHDALTGLPNRLLLQARMEHTLERATRNQKPTALLFMDLDGFKGVNDEFGHAEGDAVLNEVAHRLVRVVRAQDTVARLGGDEFVVLLDDYGHLEDVRHVAQRILEAVRRPIVVEPRTHRLGISIGVALFPDDAHDAEGLMEAADQAMYLAKNAGRGRAFRCGQTSPFA